MGYVVKNAVDTELLAAIRRVAEGRTFLDASIEVGPGKVPMGSPRTPAGAPPVAGSLNERERAVMGRLAEGYTNSQIAGELQIGVKSIEKYRTRIMEKLGLTNRSELVRFALECGILTAGK
jgi:DNA-binding NarL/FixJ family response regulator